MRRVPADDTGLWRLAVRDVAPLRPQPDRGRPARPLPNAGETSAVQVAPPAVRAAVPAVCVRRRRRPNPSSRSTALPESIAPLPSG